MNYFVEVESLQRYDDQGELMPPHCHQQEILPLMHAKLQGAINSLALPPKQSVEVDGGKVVKRRALRNPPSANTSIN